MSIENVFKKEEDVLRNAQAVLNQVETIDAESLMDHYVHLMNEYQALLNDVKFLTKISDRVQSRMGRENSDLKQKTESLSEAKEFYTKENESLISVKQSLEEEVQERTIALKRANENLTAVNAELDNFVYRAAHDIKGPIARFLGLCNLGMMEGDDPRIKNYFKLLTETAQHMNNILVRLLFVNTLKASECNYKHFSLRKVFEDAIQSVSDLMHYRLTNIRFFIKGNDVMCSDFKIVKILIQNLLEYSIGYINPQGNKENFVHFDINSSDENVAIRLHHNGVHIPQEVTHKIFDMFHRITNGKEISGMELYTSKLAANKIGGKISLISSKPRETVFEVILPSQSPTISNDKIA